MPMSMHSIFLLDLAPGKTTRKWPEIRRFAVSPNEVKMGSFFWCINYHRWISNQQGNLHHNTSMKYSLWNEIHPHLPRPILPKLRRSRIHAACVTVILLHDRYIFATKYFLSSKMFPPTWPQISWFWRFFFRDFPPLSHIFETSNLIFNKNPKLRKL